MFNCYLGILKLVITVQRRNHEFKSSWKGVSPHPSRKMNYYS